MIPHDQERTEISQALETESRITKAAENRLATFGLGIKDLQEYSQRGYILDLGADDCYIEREAKLAGFGDRVISADIKFDASVRDLGLNFHQFDATKEWPLKNSEFSLIICRQGPLFMVETSQDGAMHILNSSIKSLTRDGELLVYPPRFGYVKAQMFNEFPEYKNLQQLERRDVEQVIRNNNFNIEANRRTKFALNQLGYVFEARAAKEQNQQTANSEYLVFKHT